MNYGNKNIKLIINYLLGPVLFIILAWSLYKQIVHQPDLELRWQHIRSSWKDKAFWVVCGLMFINWGIEARKWQILIAPLEKTSLWKSFKAVMAGCSITMLTPNRIGEYGGRILFIKPEHRMKSISLTILGSISQLTVTLIMGTLGMGLLKFTSISDTIELNKATWLFGNSLFYISLIFTAGLLLFYFRVKLVVGLISKLKFFNRLNRYVKVLELFSGKQLLRILFLSIFRYIVFILQYMLLLRLMEVEITWQMSFLLLTVFYLLMALAPTIGFTELPVRATASVFIFGLCSSNILGIQAAALGIWLINLVIPAVMGSIMILSIKILKEK